MTATDIRNVVVAGAGTMGTSMAQIFAKHHCNVILYDIVDAAIERGKKMVQLQQENQLHSGDLTQSESDEIVSRLSYTTQKDCFADCDLVVENVLEDLAVKQGFWEEVSRLVRPDCLLCTNTSGLSITKIGERITGPERFCGMHWFNPAHIVPLIEVICGEKTDPATAELIYDFSCRMGKRPIHVKKDAPGFIANRLQAAILREALHIREEGIGDYEDIDGAMKYGLGFRYACMGPFEVVDQGGLDIHHHIATYLWEDLADDKYPKGAFEELFRAGHHGVKAEKGFYDYGGEKADAAVRTRDARYLAMAKADIVSIGEEKKEK